MELELILRDLQLFKLSHLAAFCTIGFNQLLLQCLKDSFHTLLTFWEHKEDMYVAI